MLGESKQVAEVAKALEVSEQTFHRWRDQYGGMRLRTSRSSRSCGARTRP